MLWNHGRILSATCTGAHRRHELLGVLRVRSSPLDALADVDDWLALGGPLDAPEWLAMGGHASTPSLAFPGQFTGCSTVRRPR